MRLCRVDGNKEALSIVERAIAIGAQMVQLFKPYFNQQSVDKAHQHGIICNVFWADDPEEAIQYREMGIDCILTNDYLAIKNALDGHFSKWVVILTSKHNKKASQ